jgi:hypothetical protein
MLTSEWRQTAPSHAERFLGRLLESPYHPASTNAASRAAECQVHLPGPLRPWGQVQRRFRWAISLPASRLLAPQTWHGLDYPRHLFRVVHLDDVSSTRDEE